MTISKEGFQTIAQMAGLTIEFDPFYPDQVSKMENDQVFMAVYHESDLGIEPVLRFEVTPEGLKATTEWQDMSGKQRISVNRAPTKNTPYAIQTGLENPDVEFFYETESNELPQKAVLTDSTSKIITIFQSGEVHIQSPTLPQNYLD